MPIVGTNQGDVYYLDAGSGPPVVLVHSGGMSSRQWSRLSARLVDRYRVVAPDLLGSGKSARVPPDAPFELRQDLAALDAVIAKIDGPVHLVGHSYGGLLALTWAREHAMRLRSIALYEPVAFGVLFSTGDTAGIHDLESYDADGTFFDDAAGGNERWMERFIDYWNGRGAWRALPDSSRTAFLEVGRKVFQEVRALTGDRTPDSAYATIRAPTLLMTGSRSTVAAQHVCRILARTLPAATLVELPDVGHMGPLSHAGLVNDHIVTHIDRAHDA